MALCLAAVMLDVRLRKLPNWLTVGALVSAVALRSPGGWGAVGTGLGSMALALAIGVPLFLVGGLGGGDVKLMGGLATFLDPGALLPALLVMACTGGVMALIAAARKRALGRVLRNVRTMLMTFVTFGRQTFSEWRRGEDGMSPESTGSETIANPYGVAIAAGALAGWFLR